jgi:AcrR family transcriptional regulator
MGISERKNRAKQELRQTILDAATQLFIADGYDKTTIRNIAEAIEYSPATIYLHFKDKDQLLFAIHEVAFTKFFEFMAPCLLIIDTRSRLLQMGHSYIQFAFDNPELYGLMFIDNAPMSCLQETDDAWVCGQKAHYLLRDTMDQYLGPMGYSQQDVDLYTMSIWAYIHGITALAIRDRFCVIKEINVDLQDMMQASLQLMLNNLLPHGK